MKSIIICLMLLATLKSNGQERIYTYGPTSSTLSAIIKGSSDTLEILRPDKIRFIKIGDRVYKIESPTLIQVNNDNILFMPKYDGPIYKREPHTTLEWKPIDTSFLKLKP